ncbi:MAG: DUF3750 domain-containing protein [cyanobacterium endosymbiont of Rhopalodia sterrenbergii]
MLSSPYDYHYRYFPGLNSKTYVRWILNLSDCHLIA